MVNDTDVSHSAEVLTHFCWDNASSKLFYFLDDYFYWADCLPSGWEVWLRYVTDCSGYRYGTLIVDPVANEVIGIWNVEV